MKTLTTDQMTTLFKTLTIFIENRDPFTTENVINELKRDGDQLNGFYDDKGKCIVDDLYEEIDDAVNSLVIQFFPDFIAEQRRVYSFVGDEYNEEDDDWDEYEELNDDDYGVDKEGNRLPDNEEVYDDTDEDEEEDRGVGWYKDPNTGEWMWDRDAAESARYEEGDFENYGQEPKIDEEEFHDPDHPIIYELKIDKQKRINIKKAIFEEAGWAKDEEVVIISQAKDHSQFFIARKKDCDDDIINLTDEEYVNGDYFLKNGALRIGTVGLFDDIEPGEIVKAKVIWNEEGDFNYIQVGFDI